MSSKGKFAGMGLVSDTYESDGCRRLLCRLNLIQQGRQYRWQTTGTIRIRNRMPDNKRVVRVDSSRRAAIQMKDNRLVNATRIKTRASDRVNREIANGMKAVSKKAVATEAKSAVSNN